MAYALLGLLVGGCLLPEVAFEPPESGVGTGGTMAGVGGSTQDEVGTGSETPAGGTGGDPGDSGAGGTTVSRVCVAPPCAAGEACLVASDCDSKVCAALACAPELALCCQAPACTDGVANGDEPVIDCGNTDCGPCALDHACLLNVDCASGTCLNGFCVAGTCSDSMHNGTETAIDCGGADPACARCADGLACAVGSDCASGTCVNALCISCVDASLNGTETDIDCGGAAPACARCTPGRVCLVDTDCTTGVCGGGRCCGGTTVDCTRCAERLSVTVNCNAVEFADPQCTQFLTCLATNGTLCPTVNAPGCSDTGDICDRNLFGGNGNPAINQATAVLTAAGCTL